MDDRDTAYMINFHHSQDLSKHMILLASRFTSINPSTRIGYGVMVFAIALLLAWMWPQAKNRTKMRMTQILYEGCLMKELVSFS
ncbi:hypothetical protein Syun_016650 [Stephania yunnanensis]|uniref:Uncharacterized protein n=1 Tax=Stephania yunnanensis TaxID=152371 RepID=A0AAP0P2D5_9MAGN